MFPGHIIWSRLKSQEVELCENILTYMDVILGTCPSAPECQLKDCYQILSWNTQFSKFPGGYTDSLDLSVHTTENMETCLELPLEPGHLQIEFFFKQEAMLDKFLIWGS